MNTKLTPAQRRVLALWYERVGDGYSRPDHVFPAHNAVDNGLRRVAYRLANGGTYFERRHERNDSLGAPYRISAAGYAEIDEQTKRRVEDARDRQSREEGYHAGVFDQ